MIAVSGVLAATLATQSASGAFRSTVHIEGKPVPDENAFVTALIIYELARWPEHEVRAAIDRALDYLLRCELQGRPGHFCFYPETAYPPWMTVRLPPDSDDTALCASLLVRFGRRPEAFLREVAGDVLRPFQLHYVSEASEPWHRVGVYQTWLRAAYPRNVVDCCVNVNVLALLAQAQLTDSRSFAAIVNMLDAAVDCAGPHVERARMLSPWYPHPNELVRAAERAVRLGAKALEPALSKMRVLPWGRPATEVPATTPVCGSRDRRFVWTCAALQELRALDQAPA